MGYPQPIFAWRSRFSDFLYKSDPSKPVRTIVAQLGKYSGPFHWKNRKFTLQEFKRLQTFPDDYQFAGGLNSALQQIGNSVPPAFAEKLARAVLQQLFGMDSGIDLIEQNERLSFDSRKASKARATKSKRDSIKGIKDMPLFADAQFCPIADENSAHTEKLFHYIHNRRRVEITSPHRGDQGGVYRFLFKRTGDHFQVDVSRYNGSAFVEAPILKYKLRFHHPVGDGIRMIECALYSDSDKDIAIAWDAIEDCLSSISGYTSMLDAFGHFTEPHPIFDLELDVLTGEPSFVLRFAKKFSSFEATAKILPAKALEELYSNGNNQKFDLTRIARYLRELRFDVRVHETNRTIPSGYFRCCYPFTLSINRQVFVTWKQTVRRSFRKVAH
jgi:DNA (cytosine-5)-methyltransferase 1